jgi:hypothetical protein
MDGFLCGQYQFIYWCQAVSQVHYSIFTKFYRISKMGVYSFIGKEPFILQIDT